MLPNLPSVIGPEWDLGGVVVRPGGHPEGVHSSGLPSGLVVSTRDREALEAILDALAPTFAEPGPRILREVDGRWERLVMIPGPWCVHSHGTIAPEVYEAGRRAFEMGATDVRVIAHELTCRPLRRLALVTGQEPS